MIEIRRNDLLALIGALQHEHFPYTDVGAAALRALKGLEQALDDDANTIALTPVLSADLYRALVQHEDLQARTIVDDAALPEIAR